MTTSYTSRTPFQLTGRYAHLSRWEVLDGVDDARPTAAAVVRDEGLIDAWRDKTVLVTGVSAGIGVETVKALALTGATVYGTVRDLDKGRRALGQLVEGGKVHLLQMDMADFANVRECAAEFRRRSDRLHVLINNAGVMNTPETTTKDGHELQFQTNHLSHFLLFSLLRDLLLSNSRPSFHSRVVCVSSAGHRYSPFRIDNPNMKGEYNGWLAYGSSKSAVIHMSNQIERLYGTRNLHAYAVHPGFFVSPNLQGSSSEEMEAALANPKLKKYQMSMPQAAATSVYGATSGELEGKGGLYLEGMSMTVHPYPEDEQIIEYGYVPNVFDQQKEESLWNLSERLTGIEGSDAVR